MMSAQGFIGEVLPYAATESARTGIPISVMLAQSGVETGWGTSGWWHNQHNPAGIGVTGKPGAGNAYPDIGTGWRDYADHLLGIGEAGQGPFVADLRQGADAPALLRDLEASPWAAGHYGGHGLENAYAQFNLGQYDTPGNAPPGAASSSSAYIAQPAGFSLNPLDWIGSIFGDVKSGIFRVALTIAFVGGGLTLVVLGMWRSVSPQARAQLGDAAKMAAVA
jgi:hypothetical protein